MLRIKCANPNCTAPGGKFTWDERAHVEGGGGLAQAGEPGAVAFIAQCPHCGMENKVWLKKVKKLHKVTRAPR